MDIATHRGHKPVPRHGPKWYVTQGFTLIEALATLAIMALLAVEAIPAMTDLLGNNRLATTTNEFLAYLNLSRSEAVKGHQRVIVCPSRDGAHCLASSEWQHGWIVFVDRNGNHKHDPNERLPARHPALAGVTLVSSHWRRKISFQADGSTGGHNATFTLCDGRGSARALAIILSNPGRLRVAHRKADGSALTCP